MLMDPAFSAGVGADRDFISVQPLTSVDALVPFTASERRAAAEFSRRATTTRTRICPARTAHVRAGDGRRPAFAGRGMALLVSAAALSVATLVESPATLTAADVVVGRT